MAIEAPHRAASVQVPTSATALWPPISPALGTAPRSRPRVLVVVRDDDDAESLRAALTAGGYAVATVSDGAAALTLAEQLPPAAIVVCGDARFPEGTAFAEGWRRAMRAPATLITLKAALPAVALSAVRRSLAQS